MVVDMEIKRLKNTKFGTNKIARVVTGWALYEAGKGWIALFTFILDILHFIVYNVNIR